LSLKYSLS